MEFSAVHISHNLAPNFSSLPLVGDHFVEGLLGAGGDTLLGIEILVLLLVLVVLTIKLLEILEAVLPLLALLGLFLLFSGAVVANESLGFLVLGVRELRGKG